MSVALFVLVPSPLHIFTSFTSSLPSHLHFFRIFTSFTSAHNCTSPHLHISTPAHLHISISAHLHICTPAHLHICTPAHLHTSPRLHTCTSLATSAYLNICRMIMRNSLSLMMNVTSYFLITCSQTGANLTKQVKVRNKKIHI